MRQILQEEMCQRAAAETMVRMLETETTEQRHMLAEERGKIAKLEALVIHLEVNVKNVSMEEDSFSIKVYFHNMAVISQCKVTYFQSEVKEKTLIADEYRARLGETEKQLQEANERVKNHDMDIHVECST